MNVLKHLALENRKQEIRGLDIASLVTDEGQTPLIVTAESGEIGVHWWRDIDDDSGPSGWYHHAIPHEPVATPSVLSPMEDILELDESQRVGIGVTGKSVFVVFKRKLVFSGKEVSGLFLSRFEWDASSQLLEPVDSQPVHVPIEAMGYRQVGYSLWAGYDELNQALLVLTQTVGANGNTAMLTLFYIAYENLLRSPDQVSSWRSHDLMRGGYDLDAKLEFGLLTYLCRVEPYVISVTDSEITFDGGIHRLNFNQADSVLLNPPLSLQTLDVSSLVVLESYDDIPGGAHHQIQRVNPLYLTCDRVESGEVLIAPDPSTNLSILRFLRLFGQKRLITLSRENEQWLEANLMDMDWTVHPRFAQREAGQIILAPVDSGVQVALRHPLLPVYLCRFQTIPDKGQEALEFIHHSIEFDGVIHTQFVVKVNSESLEILDQFYQMLDINHERITNLEGFPAVLQETAAENIQFEPLNAGLFQTNGNLFLQATPPKPYAYDFDNTLGGCLAVDPQNPRFNYFAYTDLGDGGCRVIFHDGPLPAPPVIEYNKKTMPAEAVTGPGVPGEEWIELNFPVGVWIPSGLPGFLSPGMTQNDRNNRAENWTLGSAFNDLVDSLFGFFNIDSDLGGLVEGNKIIIDDTVLNYLQDTYGDALGGNLGDLLWAPVESIPQNAAQFFEVTIRMSKYEIHYLFDKDNSGNAIRRTLEITNVRSLDTSFKFLSRPKGQGRIDYRFNIGITLAKDIKLKGVFDFLQFNSFIQINSIQIQLFQQRQFTPAILMSDRRHIDPRTGVLRDEPFETTQKPNFDEQVRMDPAAISARPVARARTEVESVRVDMNVNLFSLAVWSLTVIAALMMLGFVAMAFFIGTLLALFVSATGFLGSALIWLLLSATLFFIMWAIFKPVIESVIHSTLHDQRAQLNEGFNRAGLMTYAGEGLGEAIARMILAHPDVQEPLDQEPLDPQGAVVEGRNRHRPNFWQSIFVRDGICRVLIRR